MEFENEGIRHIEISSKRDMLSDEDNFLSKESKVPRKHLLQNDSGNVNLDSLLKAVIDINDRLHEQEEKLKRQEDGNNMQGEEKAIHNFVKSSKRNHTSQKTKSCARPKTAVLRYSQSDSKDSGESDNELFQSSSDISSVSTKDSRLSCSRKRKPISARAPEINNTSRHSMSFSNTKVKGIDMENQRLLKEILRAKAKDIPRKHSSPMRVQSAATINRTKRQQEIDRENFRLLSKLQAVKPTSGLRRDKLLSDHIKSEKNSERISKTARRRPGSAPTSRVLTRSKSREGSVLSFDVESVASSRLSSTSSRSSRAPLSRGSKRVTVKEVWEPGW